SRATGPVRGDRRAQRSRRHPQPRGPRLGPGLQRGAGGAPGTARAAPGGGGARRDPGPRGQPARPAARAGRQPVQRRGRRRLGRRPTEAERAAIRVNVDSLRALRPARADSVFNGADDDGSGSVSVLAIAQALAAAREKPARSILFIWHTAEEIGLLGSRWFTDHPTVPRDSIVAYLNLDMVGRGGAADIPGGGPTYLQLVGSRRLSTQLGDLVEEANAALDVPFDFDYSFDADGHPERI